MRLRTAEGGELSLYPMIRYSCRRRKLYHRVRNNHVLPQKTGATGDGPLFGRQKRNGVGGSGRGDLLWSAAV